MAGTQYIFPVSADLTEIAQDKIPELTQDDPIFEAFPMENRDAFMVMWEQLDNYTGLQQVRGLNGDPSPVTASGMRRFQELPGIYGEFIPLDEMEMTMGRTPGTFGGPIDITDIVMRRQDQLLQRRVDRIRWLLWTLLATGTFSVTGINSAVTHTGTYLRQTFSAGTPWSTYATSTPLNDFRQVVLKAWGHSVSFGPGAQAFANRHTINNLLLNSNSADLYGRRTAGLGTFNSLPDVNRFFLGDGLPEIVEYNKGYYAGAPVQSATDMTQYGTSFTTFIPDNTVIVLGQRPGNQPLGHFQFVRNANNPGAAPGPYMAVVDSANGDDGPPRRVQVHDGFNGGPTIEFPSAVVVMSV